MRTGLGAGLFYVPSLAFIPTFFHLPPVNGRSLIDLRALRERNFMFFALALLLEWIVFCIPPFYIPIFAIPALQEGQDHAFDSLALVSVGSFFGHTLPMLIASRFGPIQVFLGASVAAFIILFSWISIHTAGGFTVFCIIYGLTSCALVAAPGAAVSHTTLLLTMSAIGARLGVSWVFGGIGVLIGAAVAGALVDAHQASFLPAQTFAD